MSSTMRLAAGSVVGRSIGGVRVRSRGGGIGARIRSRGARMGRRSTVDAAAELASKAQQAAVLAPRAIAGACERVPRH